MASPSYEDTLPDDPAFFHLTRTNDAPLPAEETIFLNMITELEAKSVATERSLASLSAETDVDAICYLQADKKLIHEAIQRRKAVLSVVRRLPPEILGHIFIHTVAFPSRSAEEEEVKWTLGRVCKVWRACALAFPGLWSFITIRDYPTLARSNLSRLPIQLRLARNSLLSVALSITAEFRSMAESAVELLLECAARIQFLDICLPIDHMDILLPLRGRLHSVTGLTIVKQNFRSILPATRMDYFSQCHHLNTVETYAIPCLDSAFIIPWDNVTHYTGYSQGSGHSFCASNMHEAIYILEAAPKLVSAIFRFNAEPPGKLFPVECTKLESLLVTDADLHTNPPFCKLFDKLTLPALRKFGITVHPTVPQDRIMVPDVFTSIVDLVERSRSPLESISLTTVFLFPEDIARLLRVAAPTLRTCHVFETHIDDEIVRELFKVSSLLDHIKLSGWFQFDVPLFLEELLARWKVRPLATLELYWILPGYYPRKAAEQALEVISLGVKPLCASGLKFVGRIESGI